jgi:phage baseplate assembly protein W
MTASVKIGMDRQTGKPLSGAAHIAQSIADILTTPVGSRIMRRTYGSRLADLADMPINPKTLLLFAAASAGAIRRWEPRVKLKRVAFSVAATGQLSVAITATRLDLPTPSALNLTVPL